MLALSLVVSFKIIAAAPWLRQTVTASDPEDDRDCNIEPPASPYAIMRRVHPYRGENSGPGKDDHWRA